MTERADARQGKPAAERRLAATMNNTTLLREQEVAEQLAVAVQTIRQWRVAGRGPKFHRLGRAVRYSPVAIRAYLDQTERASTSATAPPEVGR